MTARRLRAVLVLGVALCFFAAIPLAGHASPPGYTQFVVLDSGNGYTDTVEAGATISQPGIGAGSTPGEGPIAGSGLVFACGTPDVADFSFSQSGLGGPFTGLLACSDRPRTIVLSDIQLTVKVTLSGNTYGVDFLSYRGDTGICVDADAGLSCAAAGGQTSYNREPASLDSTPPTTTIDLDSVSPDGLGGWYVSSVHATVSATDSESSVAETRCELDPIGAPATFDDIPSGCAYTSAGADVTSDGMHTIYAASADDAGNEETPVNASFMIDQTDPTVTCDVSAPGPVLVLGGAGGSVTATVGDASPGSGPVTTSLSGAADVSSVGSKTVSLTGSDTAGNQTTIACPYRVEYAFAGFFEPVDNLPTLNLMKAGAAVPVKFSLAGYQGMGVLAAGYPKSESIACSSTAELDGIEATVTAGSSSLSYDALANQYSYIWKTDKSWANSCRQLVVKLADGATHRANFKFNK